MPLVKIEEVSKGRFLGIWHIEESFQGLSSQLSISNEDSQLLHSFRSEKKQMEWLAGRLTLKNLCNTIKINYCGVRKDALGKPFLKDHNNEISLTHSFPYVAAIIDPLNDVGIDLEQPTDKLIRIAPKFLNDQELKFAGNNISLLCTLWCAKETLYKIYGKKGLLFSHHYIIEPFKFGEDNSFIGKVIANGYEKSYKLQYRVNNDYIMTFNI